MRAVVQRVNFTDVIVKNEKIGRIKKGLTVLLGIGKEDNFEDIKWLADKILNLRIFEDSNDKMNLSVQDISGEIMIISQFTLFGDCRKGRRPSFSNSASPKDAEPFYEKFVQYVKENYKIKVQTGKFQSHMNVILDNNGPVTFLIDSKKTF